MSGSCSQALCLPRLLLSRAGGYKWAEAGQRHGIKWDFSFFVSPPWLPVGSFSTHAVAACVFSSDGARFKPKVSAKRVVVTVTASFELLVDAALDWDSGDPGSVAG